MREPSEYVPILYNKHSRFYRVTVLQYELVKEKEWLLLCISADEFEQTDQIWKFFKSFSLLVVKEGKGSIHRLLAQALGVSQNTQDARREASFRNLFASSATSVAKVFVWYSVNK